MADSEGYNVDDVTPLILDAADKYRLKVCFHIEPYNGRDVTTLGSNLSYIVSRYGNHSAFYRDSVSRLPLYYIYDSYMVPDEQWISLLGRGELVKHSSVRGTGLDGVFLGLAVERTHPQKLLRCGFDGLYTYFAADRFTYGSTVANWAALAAAARRNNLLFVPSVGPGYDDVRIRPWNGINSRDRQLGAYYEHSFAAAIQSGAGIISITSFNEWHEGTQIEEAIPKQFGDFQYADYRPHGSDFYLRLTRKWTINYAQRKRGQ